MPKQIEWDEHWLDIASCFSKLSKDPSTQVGAVIVTPDNRQMSGGYNGFPRGVDDKSEYKWQRPEKYERVIHAEMNAVMACPFDTNGCSIYVTITPCHRCLAHLINAGIRRLVYRDTYPNLSHEEIWYEFACKFNEIHQIKNAEVIYPIDLQKRTKYGNN